MKKNFLLVAILAFVLGISSCKSSGGFESDVKKMANLRCKMQQQRAKDQTDEKVKKETDDLEKEMEEYRDKMKTKYADKENDKDMNAKADKIMDDVMAKCK